MEMWDRGMKICCNYLWKTMDQWMKEFPSHIGEEELSMLGLVFTKKLEPCPIIECSSPVGKNDHVLIKVKLQEGMDC